MQEINLYDLLRYYARNWLNLLSALLVGAIIGLVYTAFIQVPLYKSEATMLVVGSGTSTTDTTLNNNYTELFKSRLVLETTIDKQGYNGDYAQLLSRTTATNDKNTDVLKVSIADSDAVKSQQLLSRSVESFKAEVGKIYGSNNIKTVDTATLPSGAYNVDVPRQIGLAMAGTFLATIVVLFFVYDYTTSYKNGSNSSSGNIKKNATSKASSKKSKNSNSIASSIIHRIAIMTIGESKTTIKKSR